MSVSSPTNLSRPLAAAPLAWFDFADRTFPTRTVTVDGRPVPFKVLPRGATEPAGSTEGAGAKGAGAKEGGVGVLLHGMGLTGASFAGVAPYVLASHDLLLVDYNSFSVAHRWPAGGVSMRLLAAGVWKAIEATGAGRVDFIGSSLGGGLALLCTQLASHRVDRLVLINPAVYPQDLPMAYRLWRIPILGELLMAITPAEKLIEGVSFLGYSVPEKMPGDLRACYVRNMLQYRNRLQLMDIVRHLPGGPWEAVPYLQHLPTLRQEVLVLWGQQERLLRTDTPERLARDLPHVRVITFAELAHLPHDEAPERLGPLMADFLNRRGEKTEAGS